MEPLFDVTDAVLTNSLPDGCSIEGNVEVRDASAVTWLPDNLTINGSLTLRDCQNFGWLPNTLKVTKTLDLSGCTAIKALPPNLSVGKALILDGCSGLVSLRDIATISLSCRNCTELTSIGKLNVRHLNLHGCSKLGSLPHGLRLRSLNATGCSRLKKLPDDIHVGSLNLADSGITSILNIASHPRLKWRGVSVDWMTAFQPEAITVEDILKQRNAALRRVMLERFGFERFMNSVNAELLDQDSDPGGDRRLLRCNFINDEGLVCLQVRCPSTSAAYVLRVPPEMRTCRQAAAWIAGFDDAQDYAPLVET